MPILAEFKRMINIGRVKRPKALIENLDFVNPLERFGQAADRAPPLRNHKFADSPLEEPVSSELVSEGPEIPC